MSQAKSFEVKISFDFVSENHHPTLKFVLLPEINPALERRHPSLIHIGN